jgi:hypothetical protein
MRPTLALRSHCRWLLALAAATSFGCGRSGASHGSAGPSAEAVPRGAAAGPAVSATSPAAAPDTLLASRLLGRSCALDPTGLAWCWRHPLGDSKAGIVPRRVAELDHARDVASSAYFSYILRENGEVFVWGKQRHSYLGDVTSPRSLPAPRRVRQLGSAGAFVVLLDQSGNAWAVIDDFVSPDPGEPGEVVSRRPELLKAQVASLSSPAGTCLLDAAGQVLVLRGPDWRPLPDLSGVRAVADGAGTSCTLLGAGIECWRSDGQGRFSLPAPPDTAHISLSLTNVYAIGRDGRLWASLETTIPREIVAVGGVTDVTELGGSGTLELPYCLRRRDQTIGCWGQGGQRRVGRGEWPSHPQLTILRKDVDASRPLDQAP